MQLTPAQLELIRTRPQSSRLSLFIYQPRTVMQCKINDAAITKGAMTITYNNVTLGSSSVVEAGMTLLIGTTAGASDVGRIRIRSASASSFTVSENSNIQWANSLFLTVLRYFEIWPVFPRIIFNPNQIDDSIFYKDYDIAYTNQNSLLGTFVNMGPHRPVLLENGSQSVWWSSTGTLNLLGHALTYDWAFEGGTPTGSTSADPGWVTYNTVGDYVTRLIVTDAVNGAQDTSYRYVSVKNKIGEGSTTPIPKWTMTDLQGSRGEGGYSAQFTIFDTVSITDNAVIMLATDDWYGSTRQNLGGNYPNASEVFFVGYVDKDTIRYDYEKSFVQFNVNSITGLMKNSLGFSVSVQSVASPSRWYELLDMDGRRAMYHYLKWHTTVLNTVDFEFKGTDYPIQYFDSDRTSMYDALDNFMRGTFLGEVVADRQGKIWAEVRADAYANPTGSFPSVMDISKRDWKNEPSIEEKVMDEVSFLEYGGIAYSGVVTGTFAALLANAPGGAPSFRGKTEKLEGLALGGQVQLNAAVGNVWANKNSRYPAVNMQMTENLSNLDIAPQETNRIIITPSDTNRNLSLDALYIPHTMAWSYDSENGIKLPTITYGNLLNGPAGDSIIIPVTPDAGGLNTGYNIPSMRVPSLVGSFSIPGTTAWNVIQFYQSDAQTHYIDRGSGYKEIIFDTVAFNQGSPVGFGLVTGTANAITALRTGLYYINTYLYLAGAWLGTGAASVQQSINGGVGGSSNTLDVATQQNANARGAQADNIFYLNAGDTIAEWYSFNNLTGITGVEARLTIAYIGGTTI